MSHSYLCCRNIFGLVTLDSRLLTYMDKPDEFPSTRFDKLPTAPVPEYNKRKKTLNLKGKNVFLIYI